MRTDQRIIYIIAFLMCFFFVLSQSCSAYSVGRRIQLFSFVFIVFFLVSPIIESALIILIFLRNKAAYDYSINLSLLILPIFLINLITVFVTGFSIWDLGWLLSNNDLIYLVELGPLVLEFIVYYLLLNWGYRKGKFVEPFSVWRVMLIAIVANVLTLAMGITFAVI